MEEAHRTRWACFFGVANNVANPQAVFAALLRPIGTTFPRLRFLCHASSLAPASRTFFRLQATATHVQMRGLTIGIGRGTIGRGYHQPHW